MFEQYTHLKSKARKIKMLLTDNDGVLTDGGVYYNDHGEAMKLFNIRDGMGVARLRKADVNVGIITGENSLPVTMRAKKLAIEELHLGIKNKKNVLEDIMNRYELQAKEIAYIGDDSNDIEVLRIVGLSACPADGLYFVKNIVDYTCFAKGGHGAFREFAELILFFKNS